MPDKKPGNFLHHFLNLIVFRLYLVMFEIVHFVLHIRTGNLKVNYK